MVGIEPKFAISSANRSRTLLNNSSVRRAIVLASGSPARIASRTSASSGALTPPGTIPDGMNALPRQPFDHSLPELA